MNNATLAHTFTTAFVTAFAFTDAFKAWDESAHPRRDAGNERGGEFAPKDEGEELLSSSAEAELLSKRLQSTESEMQGLDSTRQAQREVSSVPALEEQMKGMTFQQALERRDLFRKNYDAAVKDKRAEDVDKWGIRFNAMSDELQYRIRRRSLEDQASALRETISTGTLTIDDAQIGRIMSKRGDVYADAGVRPSNGRYPYSPDLFRTSDLSGAKIRHYVTLPDGRTAHPDEIALARRRGRITIIPARMDNAMLYQINDTRVPLASEVLKSFDIADAFVDAFKANRTTAVHITPHVNADNAKAVTNELRAYMRVLVAKCRELCPDDTGTMRESIRYQIRNANTEHAEAYLFIGNKARPEVVVRSNLYGRRGFGPIDEDGALVFEGANGETVFASHVNASDGANWLDAAWKATAGERRALARRIGALQVDKMDVRDVELSNAPHIDGFDSERGDTVPNTARWRREGGLE